MIFILMVLFEASGLGFLSVSTAVVQFLGLVSSRCRGTVCKVSGSALAYKSQVLKRGHHGFGA